MRAWAWLLRPSINWLLVFIPVSLLAELTHQPLLTFITSALAIVPLAGLIGRATDQLAIRVGPQLGGLLNATFGNLSELIVAVLLLAAGVLLGAALLVGFESELLVSALNPALQTLKISPIFVGLILIPVIGNAAEHASAVFFAIRNKVDVTLEIAVGSSTQVALFVAPAMVFISLLVGRPMDFVFTGFEIGAVFIATLIVAVISRDGHSNWLEGVQLTGVYAIIALAAFFL